MTTKELCNIARMCYEQIPETPATITSNAQIYLSNVRSNAEVIREHLNSLARAMQPPSLNLELSSSVMTVRPSRKRKAAVTPEPTVEVETIDSTPRASILEVGTAAAIPMGPPGTMTQVRMMTTSPIRWTATEAGMDIPDVEISLLAEVDDSADPAEEAELVNTDEEDEREPF